MPTKLERAREAARKQREKIEKLEQLFKEKLDAEKEDARQADAVQREEERKADNRRCYHVGALAKEAGLFAWENTDIKLVFTVLATRLKSIPNPAAFLEGLLEDPAGDVPRDDGFLAEKPLSRFHEFSSDSAPPEGENSDAPLLETAEESDRREATRQEPAAAGVRAKDTGGVWWKR